MGASRWEGGGAGDERGLGERGESLRRRIKEREREEKNTGREVGGRQTGREEFPFKNI